MRGQTPACGARGEWPVIVMLASESESSDRCDQARTIGDCGDTRVWLLPDSVLHAAVTTVLQLVMQRPGTTTLSETSWENKIRMMREKKLFGRKSRFNSSISKPAAHQMRISFRLDNFDYDEISLGSEDSSPHLEMALLSHTLQYPTGKMDIHIL